MNANETLERIKNQLSDIEESDMTTAEKQISKIVCQFFKCTCKPGSIYTSPNCNALEHL